MNVCLPSCTYNHEGKELDAAISAISLHHLPDFWKMIALKRLNRMLKPGGRFFLLDLVFCFDIDGYGSKIDEWLQEMGALGGESIIKENTVHIREEFSTWDWVLREMLGKVGFEILNESNPLGNVKGFICKKA